MSAANEVNTEKLLKRVLNVINREVYALGGLAEQGKLSKDHASDLASYARLLLQLFEVEKKIEAEARQEAQQLSDKELMQRVLENKELAKQAKSILKKATA